MKDTLNLSGRQSSVSSELASDLTGLEDCLDKSIENKSPIDKKKPLRYGNFFLGIDIII